jgi:hypothetical protein
MYGKGRCVCGCVWCIFYLFIFIYITSSYLLMRYLFLYIYYGGLYTEYLFICMCMYLCVVGVR